MPTQTILVADLVRTMNELAPPRLAESWDNVGLLIGREADAAAHVLLTIDLTESVLDEAIDSGANAIIAYHPPIFDPIKRLTDDRVKSRIALRCAREGIAVYSPHTALDAAPGGVNDWLAAGLGEGDIRALTPNEHLPASQSCKLVTFCPEDAVDRLRDALASVGAGRIGHYERCSFETRGVGTFFGDDETTPAVGRASRLERVDEVRLEMVCPKHSLSLAVVMIRQFHPYEEPPIDIYPLHPRPERSIGAGRRIVLDHKVDAKTLTERIRKRLNVSQVRMATGDGAPRKFTTIGLCVGAGGSLLDTAIEQGCEVFLTGEMRHHDVLDARSRGCSVILAGHTNTERGYLRILKKRLTDHIDGIDCVVSKKDVDPLKVMSEPRL